MNTSSATTLKIQPPRIYDHLPGDSAGIYRAICCALSGREADWASFRLQDWRLLEFIAAPHREGVGPLLFHHFRRAGWPETIPGRVQAGLERMYYNGLAYNTLILNERDRLLRLFDRAGIPAVVLKGAALAEKLYADPALRPMGDLDLLVHREQLLAAHALLVEQGYLDEKPDLWAGLNAVTGFELTMVERARYGRTVNVELHWDLLGGRKRPDLSWFWARQAVVSERDGLVVRGLAPSAALLYAAAHLAYKHPGRRARLIWYFDLAELMRQHPGDLDWEEIRQRSIEFGWSAGVYDALSRAAERYHPGGFSPDPAGWRSAAEALDYDRFLERSYVVGGLVANSLERLSVRDRIRKALSLAFPSVEYMRWRYQMRSDWMLPYYYFVRWLNFIRRSGRRV